LLDAAKTFVKSEPKPRSAEEPTAPIAFSMNAPLNHRGLSRTRAAVGSYLHPRRHTALLVVIIAAFMVRPLLGESKGTLIGISVALIVLMLVALYTVEVDELVGERTTLLAERRRRRIVAWMLAIPALVERVVVTFAPSHRLYRFGVASWLLFFAFITWSELRAVIKQKEVTGETISMAVSVYLLLGLCWGVLYILIFVHDPQAFNFGSSPSPTLGLEYNEAHLVPVFVYFSLTTLATIGYGDITPVSLQARYAAVAEGITGQFYLAILVARLVGLYITRSVSSDSRGERAP